MEGPTIEEFQKLAEDPDNPGEEYQNIWEKNIKLQLKALGYIKVDNVDHTKVKRTQYRDRYHDRGRTRSASVGRLGSREESQARSEGSCNAAPEVDLLCYQ